MDRGGRSAVRRRAAERRCTVASEARHRWPGSTWQVRRAFGGKLAHSLRELRPIAAAHPLGTPDPARDPTPFGVPGPGCGPTPFGVPGTGVWSNTLRGAGSGGVFE